jgi:outer membrane protein assembly factor BamB
VFSLGADGAIARALLILVMLPVSGCGVRSLVLTAQAASPVDVPPATVPAATSVALTLEESDFGEPINEDMAGVVCFRGNAGRNHYGVGPVPTRDVRIKWRAPIGGDSVEPRWSGVGWTGQPVLAEWPKSVRRHMNFLRGDGPEAEVIVGALDGRVHFYDAETGKPSRPALAIPGPNLIKGSVSLDPRGYPLLYVGCGLARSRAGFRVYSLLDFRELLWLPGSDPKAPRRWPAFDSNSLVLDDRLTLAGENGLFYSIDLNTRWDEDTGKLRLKPSVVKTPLTSAGVESSLAVHDGFAYCGDNAGDVWRINLENPKNRKRIFQLGDDADSTITFDGDGSFYVGREIDRRGAGAMGSVFKLSAPEGKLLWRWDFAAQTVHGKTKLQDLNGGILSTPAVSPADNLVFVTTAHQPRVRQGSLVALSRADGKPRWNYRMRGYAWSSPAVVDGAVVAGDSTGAVYVREAGTGKSLLRDKQDRSKERLTLGGTIEGSPLIWKGRIYYGVRGGALVCLEEVPHEAQADGGTEVPNAR